MDAILISKLIVFIGTGIMTYVLYLKNESAGSFVVFALFCLIAINIVW